jgi:dUTP pyrophosphatase
VGLDLSASDQTLIPPHGRSLVPTGLAVEIPEGHEGQVRLRSGVAARSGLILPNAPGTIDADYRGEIRLIVANLSDEPYVVRAGDRLAQIVIAPVARVTVREVKALRATARGKRGLGHTGR